MKTFKKILSLLLVICMLASVFSLTSCKKDKNDKNDNETSKNDNETGKNDNGSTSEEKITYTVTIVDTNNKPIEGVKLTMSDIAVFPSFVTDKNGKASAEFTSDKIYVLLNKPIPDGYICPDATIQVGKGKFHAQFAKDSTELTITLESEPSGMVDYTVKVIDQDGNPVVGMEVQLCPGGTCLRDNFFTAENGEAHAETTPGKEVHVKLLGLNGYELPEADSNGYHGVIRVNETEITITVVKL